MNKSDLEAIAAKLEACHLALYALYSVSGEVSEDAMKNIGEMLEEITSDVEGAMRE